MKKLLAFAVMAAFLTSGLAFAAEEKKAEEKPAAAEEKKAADKPAKPAKADKKADKKAAKPAEKPAEKKAE